MTLAQLGELAGVTSAHLCNVEQGFSTPSGKVLAALGRALSVDPPGLLLRPVVLAQEPVPAHQGVEA
jgi:transcriptional regulator with XRE-family HTH domain